MIIIIMNTNIYYVPIEIYLNTILNKLTKKKRFQKTEKKSKYIIMSVLVYFQELKFF